MTTATTDTRDSGDLPGERFFWAYTYDGDYSCTARAFETVDEAIIEKERMKMIHKVYRVGYTTVAITEAEMRETFPNMKIVTSRNKQIGSYGDTILELGQGFISARHPGKPAVRLTIAAIQAILATAELMDIHTNPAMTDAIAKRLSDQRNKPS